MQKSEQINELAIALSRAQGEMESAKRDANNPFFNSKYSTLESVWDACRGPLSKNGLSVIQTTLPDDEKIIVETTLAHASGQWISGVISMRPGYINKAGEFIQEKDAQAFGSCLTYARRYALAAICGVCPEDDDGNKSSNPEKKTQVRSNAPAQQFKPTPKPAMEGDSNDFRSVKSYQKLVEGFKGGAWKEVQMPWETDKMKGIKGLTLEEVRDQHGDKFTFLVDKWTPKSHDVETLALRAALDAAREDHKDEMASGAKD